MPATSKQQFKYIWAMRNKYGSKSKAPKRMKWVFDDEWTDVDFKKLPKKKKQKKVSEKLTHLLNFNAFNDQS